MSLRSTLIVRAAVSPLRPRYVTAGAAAMPPGRGVAVAAATASCMHVTAWRP